MKNTTPLKADKKFAQVATSQAPAGTTPKAAYSRPSTSDAGASASDAGPSEDAIRGLAYEKWHAAGCPEGDGVEFWLDAEKEISPSDQS